MRGDSREPPGMALKVVLLSHSPDPERAVATAARNCYSPRDIYIESYFGQYTAAVNSAAGAALAGTLSTFEFLAILPAAITAGEFLAILAAVGVSAFVIWEAFKCAAG